MKKRNKKKLREQKSVDCLKRKIEKKRKVRVKAMNKKLKSKGNKTYYKQTTKRYKKKKQEEGTSKEGEKEA